MKALVATFFVGFTALSNPTLAEDFRSTLKECSENRSHVEMSGCIEAKMKGSEQHLAAIESDLRSRLHGWDEDAEYRKRAIKSFDDSAHEFLQYRDAQCNAIASMAAGGNSAHDLRMACIYQLNGERLDQLSLVIKEWLI